MRTRRSKKITDDHGKTQWLYCGMLHRDPDEGPAVIWADGSKEWFMHGKRHRISGPAIEYNNGDKYWYENGKLHRIDNPAIIFANGTMQWYNHGDRHRIDGPAIIYNDGRKEWWENSQLLYSYNPRYDVQKSNHYMVRKPKQHTIRILDSSLISEYFIPPVYHPE